MKLLVLFKQTFILLSFCLREILGQNVDPEGHEHGDEDGERDRRLGVQRHTEDYAPARHWSQLVTRRQRFQRLAFY